MPSAESESLTNYYRKRLNERIEELRPLYNRLLNFEKSRLMLTRILVSLQKAHAFPGITQAATTALRSPLTEWPEKVQALQMALTQEQALNHKEGTRLIQNSLNTLLPVTSDHEGYQQDLQTVRNIAHSLAGSGGTYGFKDISDLARRVELAEPHDLMLALEQLLLLLHQHALQAQPTPPQAVLLLQKDPDLRYVIQHHLQAAGLQCQAVETATEAWQEISKTTYPVIITDLVLPDLDGRRLLFEFQQHPETSNSKIVVLASQQQLDRQENLNASALLSKPLQPEVLVKKVQELLLLSDPKPVQSSFDQLTGLPQFNALKRYIQASKDPDSILILFALHGASSERLRHFTQLLKAQINPQDFPANYQQDQFLLFLPNTRESEVPLFLKELHTTLLSVAPELIESETFSLSAQKLSEAGLETQIMQMEETLRPFANYLEAQSQTHVQQSNLAAENTAKPVRILLADDDPLIAAILRFRIEQEELLFDSVSDGEAVLPSLLAELPDLLILDVKMPGKDGFTVLKELRKYYSPEQLPVMMLTALGNESHVIQGLESGANDYMQKPFSPDELISRLHLLLRKKAQTLA